MYYPTYYESAPEYAWASYLARTISRRISERQFAIDVEILKINDVLAKLQQEPEFIKVLQTVFYPFCCCDQYIVILERENPDVTQKSLFLYIEQKCSGNESNKKISLKAGYGRNIGHCQVSFQDPAFTTELNWLNDRLKLLQNEETARNYLSTCLKKQAQ